MARYAFTRDGSKTSQSTVSLAKLPPQCNQPADVKNDVYMCSNSKLESPQSTRAISDKPTDASGPVGCTSQLIKYRKEAATKTVPATATKALNCSASLSSTVIKRSACKPFVKLLSNPMSDNLCHRHRVTTMTAHCPCPANFIASVESMSQALEKGTQPLRIDGCTGGAYFLRDTMQRLAAVFKPSDEEPYTLNNPNSYLPFSAGGSMRAGICPGMSSIRECVAYLLDASADDILRASVPPTVLATAYHPKFHVKSNYGCAKIGSLQAYVKHDCSADDLGPSIFNTSEVHAMVVFDIRLANQDRHGGNVLVKRFNGSASLIPIDHGCCLPNVFAMNQTTFEWMSWPQAKLPFSKEMADAISRLDSFADERMLRTEMMRWKVPAIDDEAMLTLHVCTLLLQRCVARGKSAYEIGSLMCRNDMCGLHDNNDTTNGEEAPSLLEQWVQQALDMFLLMSPMRAQCKDWLHDVSLVRQFVRVFDCILVSHLDGSQDTLSSRAQLRTSVSCRVASIEQNGNANPTAIVEDSGSGGCRVQTRHPHFTLRIS